MTGVHGGFKTACFCLEVLVIFGGRVRFVATVICNVCNRSTVFILGVLLLAAIPLFLLLVYEVPQALFYPLSKQITSIIFLFGKLKIELPRNFVFKNRPKN